MHAGTSTTGFYRSAFVLSVLMLGLSGITAQTVLLRELLILFSGNELTLGIIIGTWVVAEAIGACVAGRRRGGETRGHGYLSLTLVSTLVFPVALMICRLFKPLAGLPTDIGVGLGTVLSASLIVLLPVGFMHGMLFIHACTLENSHSGEGAIATGRIYYLETAGTIAGGITVNFLLIPSCNSFQIALVMLLVNGCSCLLLANDPRFGGGPARIASLVLSVAGAAAMATDSGSMLQEFAVVRQWPGRTIVAYRNSPYQNITVMHNEGQYTFLANGIPRIVTPIPDIGAVEDLVHLTILSHPSPRTILVIGGGVGGTISELIKYREISSIDYIELDPLLIQAIRDFPTPLTRSELTDPRVRILIGDARHMLRSFRNRYDVVLLNQPLPETLQDNRFFSREFFVAIRGTLAEGGIISFPATGSLTTYNRELKAVNATLLRTLGEVFPRVMVLPGETNIFLASSAMPLSAVTTELLREHLLRHKPATAQITPEYLDYRLDPLQSAWFLKELSGVRAELNRDFSPRALFHTMAYHHLIFNPWIGTLFTRNSLVGTLLVAGACGGGLLALRRHSRKRPVIAVTFAIASTGLAAMLFELFLLFGFQVLYGCVFYQVGLLITVFMGGIAAGGWVAVSRLKRGGNSLRLFLQLEGSIVVMSCFLASLFGILEAGTVGSQLLIPALLFAAGVVTGMEFPIATRLHELQGNTTLSRSSGRVYAADLAGGWLGGILGGFILLPLVGLVPSFLLIALLKCCSLWLCHRCGKHLTLSP
jgi:spermidine synthase